MSALRSAGVNDTLSVNGVSNARGERRSTRTALISAHNTRVTDVRYKNASRAVWPGGGGAGGQDKQSSVARVSAHMLHRIIFNAEPDVRS